MSKTYEKIIECGLYLLVFLLPWQTRWIIRPGVFNDGYSEYGTISLYGTDLVLIFLLALFVIFKFSINNHFPIFKHKIFLLITGLLDLLIFISIFYSPDKLIALQKYFWFLLGVGLFWLVVSVSYDRIKMLHAFLAGAITQATLGIWQFLSQSSFASKWLGMAIHDPGVPGTSVVETLAGERWLRAYGGLDHPNILGGLLVLGILSIFLFLEKKTKTQDTRTQTNYSNQTSNSKSFGICNLKFVYILYLVFCILITALFFTFSRAAWAGLILGTLIIFLSALIKKDLSTQKYLLKIVLAGGIMIFIFFNLFSDLVLTRLSRDTRLEIKSNTERVVSLKSAREIISNNWIFGVGAGNYTHYLHKMEPDLKAWDYQPVHNVFLLIWAEIGILGLVLFITALCVISYELWKRVKTSRDEVYKISLLAALIVMFQFDHWWWSGHFGILFFWLIIGIILSSARTDSII
ncbi:MAG: O-antigen ligase family protein [Candidatus Falkowbacteria bacterium]